MTTTKRISGMFTLFSSILIFVFGIVLNAFFLAQRYTKESRDLEQFGNIKSALTLENLQQLENTKNIVRKGVVRNLGPNIRVDPLAPVVLQRFANIITLPKDEAFPVDAKKKNIYQQIVGPRKNILRKGKSRYMFAPAGDDVHFKNISPIIERQKNLLIVTISATLFFALLCYLFSHWFTRYALRDLDSLSKYVHDIDIETVGAPDHGLRLDHLPEDDRIRTVLESIHSMQSRIHTDIQRIKRFVSNVSHELKTPLMVMQSGSELALASTNYKTGLMQNIAQIKRLNALLGALIDQTRADHTAPTNTLVHMAPLIDSIYEEMKIKHTKKLHYIQDISPNTRIYAHEATTHMILSNLIDNACKYSPEGSSIYIGRDSDTINTNDTSRLLVRDTGSGIPAETLPHIWEPFWQGDTAREADTGFGLGLSLVHQLVKKQGRSIDVQSSAGGTTFLISGIKTVTT